VSAADGYYWLAQWMAYLCERFKLLDEDQVFCVAVDERDAPNYARICPFAPVDLGTMGRRAVSNRLNNPSPVAARCFPLSSRWLRA
jgi:hypothetical protein